MLSGLQIDRVIKAMKNDLSLSKAILFELHQYFDEVGLDNYDHIMTVKRVIMATCKHFPSKSKEIESELYNYIFDLFWQAWKLSAEEDEEDYDLNKEHQEASRVFRHIYRKEENIW